MTIIIDPNAPEQRPLSAADVRDHDIAPGDYFGTSSHTGNTVWHFDGVRAVRVGVSQPDQRSMTELRPGEGLREALERVPMFVQADFHLHRMQLPPGAYHPRIARPNDQHADEAPGYLPYHWLLADVMMGTLNEMRSLVGMLDGIFQVVHPSPANMDCYGAAIRNLLLLACTECEAQWRGILSANGMNIERPKTTDFVKLLPVMRLSEYAVRFQQFPWIEPIRPFVDWNAENPTQSLRWYDNYNAAKHDREAEFGKANLASALHAVAAVWIMVAAQFGFQGIRAFDDLHRYFTFQQVPRWKYSEVYTYGYQGFRDAEGPKNLVF